MIEKVNPSHPDKVADRIAGAIVDLAYKAQDEPKIAVEVLIGHDRCHIVVETSVHFTNEEIERITHRIAGDVNVDYHEVPQDAHLAENQSREIRCGDNGIFKGVPIDKEIDTLAHLVHALYEKWPTDGKFIYDESTETFIACQSNAKNDDIEKWLESSDLLPKGAHIIINPLGEWTGGTNVDTGATNRKLGSDMGRAVTGGGLHGKDLSKADVAVNIVCHMMAQETGLEIEALCAIGDDAVQFRRADGKIGLMPYKTVVKQAAEFVKLYGGFEKLAEWGLF